MFDARVPALWKKISWESTTLGFWFTELLERHVQFFSWIFEGRPIVFWMTGFFNPQGIHIFVHSELKCVTFRQREEHQRLECDTALKIDHLNHLVNIYESEAKFLENMQHIR